jgi:transcriptional regulator with XRE-family HTH domain
METKSPGFYPEELAPTFRQMSQVETGAEFWQRRRELGLRIGELARLAGVSRVTIWRLETGKPVGRSSRRLVALALDRPELFGGSKKAA